MQDAFNLAWKLALVVKGKVGPDILKSYETERMPVVAEMLALSNELHTRAFSHIPSTAFPSAPPTEALDPMLRSVKLLQLGVNYRWSPLLRDERNASVAVKSLEPVPQNPYGLAGDNRLAVGDRAPFFGNGDVSLFSLLHDFPSHLVLYFPPSGSVLNIATLDALRSLGDDLFSITVVSKDAMDGSDQNVHFYHDPEGSVLAAYEVTLDRDTFIIIRPDGVLGAYVFSVSGVCSYLNLLGVSCSE
ncbi:FAD-binding-3 domain-containing protein [Mycena indigotica]|uniref:FAD-binding-3 domain-containing protein n=1 Tax=Mycena indigotica TaxID=2126181 RepID=A0A8H6RYM3_9AGAR|nr:FAD-binding-3 domain-containing protein [Mycena indigotica]KAF7288975.1 FAD-binding-3 domain-containing protein [Mycena indigotica]